MFFLYLLSQNTELGLYVIILLHVFVIKSTEQLNIFEVFFGIVLITVLVGWFVRKSYSKREDIIISRVDYWLSLFLLTCLASIIPAILYQFSILKWFRELVPFLIDLSGWDAEDDAEGQTTSAMGYSLTQVERDYSSGDKSLNIQIVDGGYAPMAYAGIQMMMNFEVDTSEEYIKKTEVKGFNGIEKYTYEDKEAEVMLLVAKRFIVHLSGEEFEGTEELVTIAGSLDLEGLAKLAK